MVKEMQWEWEESSGRVGPTEPRCGNGCGGGGRWRRGWTVLVAEETQEHGLESREAERGERIRRDGPLLADGEWWTAEGGRRYRDIE